MEPIILVHGGAGNISEEDKRKLSIDGVKQAARIGYQSLQKGGSVLNAVEDAVKFMEDCEIFNAGKGSVLNADGEVEMDASIMLGADLSAGAVTVVKNIKNPISLARRVMEKTTHILLAGEGAEKFAKSQNFEILSKGALVTEATKKALEKLKTEIPGTVGAVGIDCKGNLAAATSTGGRTGKMVGRSSDTCMIGSGTYADNEIGAVSTTGHGETIAKFCLAHAIIKEMENGENVQTATFNCIEKMTKRLNNTAGAITLSKTGDVGYAFSTPRMSWAYIKGNELHFGINKNEHNVEKV